MAGSEESTALAGATKQGQIVVAPADATMHRNQANVRTQRLRRVRGCWFSAVITFYK
jgi:hypothetical protein